jgi:hypothetical protein
MTINELILSIIISAIIIIFIILVLKYLTNKL